MKPFLISLGIIFSLCLKTTTSFAEDKPLYPGFVLPAESKAYQQFMMRPQNDLSRLIYLIDRFVDSDVQVLYENHYYPAFFAARIARAFLPGHYKDERPEAWIMQWCSTSFPSGAPVWLKFSDGSFKLAREIFIAELKSLDQLVVEKSAQNKTLA